MKCSRNDLLFARSSHIKAVHSLMFLILMVLSTPFTVYGDIPASERAALIALYNSTNGDDWTDNSGWKTEPVDVDGFAMPGTENTWYGISVTGDSVDVIFLTQNNLTGAIPSELENLTNLSVLNLFGNQPTGPIPPELGNLANLTSPMLVFNQLTGPIPPELGNLTNLNELNLSGNQLTGPIPPELGNLTNLTRLWLSSNQLTDSIPPELGNLENLTSLMLAFNQLTGSVPPDLGNLTNLNELNLSGNQLTGSIPPELGNLTNLTRLLLSFNELTGSIPQELGNLINLNELHLSGAQLTGSIPPGLGNLTNLTRLWLSFSELTGSIPQELGNLINLNELYLHGNQLTGPIPSELGDLFNLTQLSLSINELTGPIPSELGNLINLNQLDLYDNQLTGPIPSELRYLINLEELKLNDNQLTGNIPTELGDLVNLNELNLSNNQLTGPIPTELGNLINLNRLFLHNNQLTGTIPPELEDLTELEFLTVNANRFTNPPNGTVVLIIDSGLSRQIDSELNQFKTDLNNEGYTVVENAVGDITPPEVRSYLQELYIQTDENLEGAILIGKIPYAYQYYEVAYNTPLKEREVISYQYYSDLDGTFEASSDYVSPGGKDYSFNLHSGDRDWEIWVGVLPYYKGNLTDTVSALKRYFTKNHEYRTCGYALPEAFLQIHEGYDVETMEEHSEIIEQRTNGYSAWTPFSSAPSTRIYFDSPPGGLSIEQGYADLSAGVADFTYTNVHGGESNNGQIMDIQWVENNPVKTAFFSRLAAMVETWIMPIIS